MPITSQSELPEWENLVTQVNNLYKLFPEVSAFRDEVAVLRRDVSRIDGIMSSIRADVNDIKNDVQEIRRRVERVEWGSPKSTNGSWVPFAVGLLAIILAALVLYLVAVRQ
jgi:hypothetical protein